MRETRCIVDECIEILAGRQARAVRERERERTGERGDKAGRVKVVRGWRVVDALSEERSFVRKSIPVKRPGRSLPDTLALESTL